jgi:hypothetical protein
MSSTAFLRNPFGIPARRADGRERKGKMPGKRIFRFLCTASRRWPVPSGTGLFSYRRPLLQSKSGIISFERKSGGVLYYRSNKRTLLLASKVIITNIQG